MTGAVGWAVRRWATVLALGSVATASACSPTADPAPSEPSRVPADRRTATPTATPTSSPSVTPRPPGPDRVRIAIAGDIHFEGVLASGLRRPATVLRPAAAALAAADLAIANLETSVGSGGRPEPGKRFTFSAGPAAFEALAAAGIDVASMANNHALDFGRARLRATLRAADAARPALSVVGIGADEDAAFAPSVADLDGTRVATIAASVADQDPTADPTGAWAAGPDRAGVADAVDPRRLLAEVRRADAVADVVVTYLHWGIQGERCPSADQRSLARRLVGAGADVVVGSHAHELQGDGRLGPGYVAYGLGNFAWYSPGPTGVLTLTVRPPLTSVGRAHVTASRWWPATIGADGLASPDSGPAAAASHDRRRALRACAGLG